MLYIIFETIPYIQFLIFSAPANTFGCWYRVCTPSMQWATATYRRFPSLLRSRISGRPSRRSSTSSCIRSHRPQAAPRTRFGTNSMSRNSITSNPSQSCQSRRSAGRDPSRFLAGLAPKCSRVGRDPRHQWDGQDQSREAGHDRSRLGRSRNLSSQAILEEEKLDHNYFILQGQNLLNYSVSMDYDET